MDKMAAWCDGIAWQWHAYSSLTPDLLYRIMAERQAVFVVEQRCPYIDADGLDHHAWHLIGFAAADPQEAKPIAGYLRVVFPGRRFEEPSIGRVMTTRAFRGQGLGRALLAEGIRGTERRFPGRNIHLSAQAHLIDFYAEQGFVVASAPYDEDGIPHVEMVRLSTP
jgi:ElaA protein